jgi:hypothetical protein
MEKLDSKVTIIQKWLRGALARKKAKGLKYALRNKARTTVKQVSPGYTYLYNHWDIDDEFFNYSEVRKLDTFEQKARSLPVPARKEFFSLTKPVVHINEYERIIMISQAEKKPLLSLISEAQKKPQLSITSETYKEIPSSAKRGNTGNNKSEQNKTAIKVDQEPEKKQPPLQNIENTSKKSLKPKKKIEKIPVKLTESNPKEKHSTVIVLSTTQHDSLHKPSVNLLTIQKQTQLKSRIQFHPLLKPKLSIELLSSSPKKKDFTIKTVKNPTKSFSHNVSHDSDPRQVLSKVILSRKPKPKPLMINNFLTKTPGSKITIAQPQTDKDFSEIIGSASDRKRIDPNSATAQTYFRPMLTKANSGSQFLSNQTPFSPYESKWPKQQLEKFFHVSLQQKGNGKNAKFAIIKMRKKKK